MKITVYTLTTDNDSGHTCAAFATEAERDERAWATIKCYDEQKDLRSVYDNPLDAWAEIQENDPLSVDHMGLDSHEIDVPVNAGLLAAATKAMVDLRKGITRGGLDRFDIANELASAIVDAESPALTEGSETREVPCCSECGSTDVKKDAWAVWKNNNWAVSSVHDEAWCNKCDSDTGIDWKLP